ncbi:DcrB-related protein [Pseudomonas sp. PSKL.D1]|uniref:DcrB-related protein n=1 Tax=Pseudomonas sp. PSKL.D1 TaxID=3029060 RepID=UPI002380EE1D|nr:DcrB-related protein [Pseudomonas sp. PSKL.D1]WDY56482.1 DcrB-related protein [Pseudomonas sp. PSKL.D1]
MRGNIYDRLSERREREERVERERQENEAKNSERFSKRRFCTNEVSFVRPERLKDKTFHVLSLADGGASPFSVVVGRSRVEANSELEEHAHCLVNDINKSLPHLQWVEYPIHLEVAGVASRRLEYRWRQKGSPVHQIQFVFLGGDEFGKRLLLQITATSNDVKGMSTEERQLFETMVQSVELKHVDDDSASVTINE